MDTTHARNLRLPFTEEESRINLHTPQSRVDWDAREAALVAREVARGELGEALVEVEAVPGPGPQGYAALLPETLAAIARRGGRRAHEMGAAHEWTREEASAAGRKGGLSRAAKKRLAKAAGTGSAGGVP